MAFVEDHAAYFADFGAAATLAGVAVVGMFDVQSFDVLDAITQGPSFLLKPGAAVTATPGQALVVGATTYTVRQVLAEPPDGALQRLVLARA